MSDWVDVLYSQFLLRDLLGYAVPGALVCLTVAYCVLDPGTRDLLEKNALVNSYAGGILFLGLAYLVGHAVSGLAFNAFSPNPVFAYYPYSSITTNRAAAQHQEQCSAAITHLNSPETNRQRERFSVLVHVTGNSAAAVLVSGLVYGFFTFWPNAKAYASWILLSAFFVGLWLHHFRARGRRFEFEKAAVERAERRGAPATARTERNQPLGS